MKEVIKMQKFSKIGQYRNAVKAVTNHYIYNNLVLPTSVDFTGTVKLHGTNAAICRQNYRISYQSRIQKITPDSDNYGYASYMEEYPNHDGILHKLFDHISDVVTDDIIIYGEWIGSGIQKGMAINNLDSKQFVMFACKLNGEYKPIMHLPEYPAYNIYNIHYIDTYSVNIDFTHPKLIVDELISLTDEVAEHCPWGKRFNIDGTGEGIVWAPSSYQSEHMSCIMSDFWFKTKAEKFNKNHGARHRKIGPSVEQIEGVSKCVDLILDEERLNKGLAYMKEMNLDLTPENTSAYLKWVGKDCKTEELDTIQENGLEWKDVSKEISIRTRQYYFSQFDLLNTSK